MVIAIVIVLVFVLIVLGDIAEQLESIAKALNDIADEICEDENDEDGSTDKHELSLIHI